MRNVKPHLRGRSFRSVAMATAVVMLFGLAASAASYARTTLKQLTQRAVAVVEVEVLDHNYPEMKPTDTFPRTHVNVQVLRSLKGNLSDAIELDLPGGINGDTIGYVPDAPDFRKGDRAIVFVKEPEAGHYMVQDLGLGKFNVVERNGKKFVENPVCPQAIAPGSKLENQSDVDATLLTKSIPYATFCQMVEAYAAGKEAAIDPSELAAKLPGASADSAQVPSVVANAAAMREAAELRRGWLILGLIVATVAFISALLVYRRKRKLATARAVVAILFGATLAGVIFGGAGAHAFVTFDQKTVWNLDVPIAGKVAGQKIIWKQTPAVSKTNANVFPLVQGSFDKWASVTGSRLSFTTGTSNTTTASSNDAENIVAWTTTPSNDFSASTLAITFSSFSAGTVSNFRDGDIIFNDRDFNWGAGGQGNASSVSLHEIGHFVGLNHTTDKTTVMFPFDGGLTQLSADEIAAAQELYPGTNPGGTSGTPPPPPPPTPPAPPVANASASPTSGLPGTTVSFTSTGSAAGTSGSPIATFAWAFGDGATATGATVSHTYTVPGTFSASLTVTDGNGTTAASTVTIQIGQVSDPTKASFKLAFNATGKDNFTAAFSNSALIGVRAPKGGGSILHGSVTIGDQPWLFDFDTAKLKSTNREGPKISVNDKTGILTLQIKSADLREVLGGHGAINADVLGQTINVPVQIWFGDGEPLYVVGVIPFTYTSKKDKSGSGKF